MAPKGKKGKKAAEQAAELERLAEEQRLAEIAEQERLEKERLEREEQERLRKEEEARLQAELDARLVKEAEENQAFYAERKKRLDSERFAASEETEWRRYVAGRPLPDTAAESSVNEMLTDWLDKPGVPLEASMDDAELAHQVLAELRAEELSAQEMQAAAQAEWQARLGVEVGDALLGKLDVATAEFLQIAEQYVNAKNECMVSYERPSLKYGLWVNLAKNPRVKQIDFAELSVSTELPKSLALASVAIRAMHYEADRMTPTGPAEGFGGARQMTLGGVLHLELLGLPPSTKKVKGWTLRQVSEGGAAVTRQHYPAPVPGASHVEAALSASAPQLRISYPISPHVLVPATQAVGWWDEESKTWKSEGVAEVGFDAETRLLSFLTPRITAVALVSPADLDLPYKNWLLSPHNRSSCRLTLETQRYLVEFDVEAGGVTLRAPRLPELAPLLDTPMAPTKLLFLLRESGINLAPRAGDVPEAKYEDKKAKYPKPKLSELERDAAELLAPLLCSLQVAPSRWSEKQPDAKLLYRVAPKKEALVLDDEATGDDAPKEAPDPFAAIDASWQPILVKHKGAGDGTALVKALDSAKVYDEGVIDGHEAHSTPLLCLGSTYPDLVDELKQSPMLYQDMIRQLLNSLRLFSFTTRPEPPKEKK